jgi:hypothetical protein
LDDAFDRGAAGVAGLGLAIVDAEGLFEVAGFATFVEEIAQGGAAHFDGGSEDFADGGGEAFEAREADFAGGEGGADAGHKEGFAGVDIADADDAVAVHDEGFDGGLAVAGEVVEVAGGEVGAEGFGAEVFEEGVESGVAVDPLDGAEAAWVVEAEFHTGVEAESDVVVFAPGDGGSEDAKAAGHAEVDEEGAASGGEEEVFASARAGQDGGAFDFDEVIGHGPAESAFLDDEFADGVADEVGADTAQGGFDLGEFGHGEGRRLGGL